MEINEIKIGNRIKLIRKKLCMTQAQFGENFGANHSIVSHWEKGNTLPVMERLIEISKLGNVTLEWLILGGSTLNFGQRIKAIRKKLNMTTIEFGEETGTSNAIVSRWENNKFEPNNERAILIAKLGNIPVESLLTGVGFDERI